LAVRRSPSLDHVNITNSSMHALQVLIPHGNLIINKLNVTHNRGRGITLWLSNPHGTSEVSGAVLAKMNIIPYDVRGLLNMCAVQKKFTIANRIIMFYKYDSYPVDCVKTFVSPGRNILFRFLLVSLFLRFSPDLFIVD
uniref:Recep_L_domain domain-containing protein n=1 Tax=Gongylonema pulchrum TaxID=637853 RepID=A0A183D330_9BILA